MDIDMFGVEQIRYRQTDRDSDHFWAEQIQIQTQIMTSLRTPTSNLSNMFNPCCFQQYAMSGREWMLLGNKTATSYVTSPGTKISKQHNSAVAVVGFQTVQDSRI